MTIRNVEIQCEILRRALLKQGHHVHIKHYRFASFSYSGTRGSVKIHTSKTALRDDYLSKSTQWNTDTASRTEERLATSVAMRDGLYFMLSTFNVLLGKLKVDDVMSTFLSGKPEEREAYQLNLDRLAHGKLDHAV